MAHRLRETVRAGPVTLCKIACSPDTWKTEPDARLDVFASGWESDVDCRDCIDRPLPWVPWQRKSGGEVRNYGTIRLIPNGDR